MTTNSAAPQPDRPAEPTTSAPATLTDAVAAHVAEGGLYGTGATEYDRFSKIH